MTLTPADIDLNYHGQVVVFDLDDTLYAEADYMWSGFRAIIASLPPEAGRPDELFAAMQQAYRQGNNSLDALAQALGLNSEEAQQQAIKQWLKIYRSHTPTLTLPQESRDLLEALSREGYKLGIITDGRSCQQRAKIAALGIEKYFEPQNIYISQEQGADKQEMQPWSHFVHRYPEARKFIYVGDNPAKDFLNPNLMGWLTIAVRDKGRNIHPQNLQLPHKEYYAAEEIDSLGRLMDILKRQ